MTGPTSAQTTVVMARSYSRSSGHTSVDATTNASGSAARQAAAIRCSCAGWAYEWSRQTATPIGCSPATARATVSGAPSGRATNTSPWALTRSGTSKVRDRGTSGGGGV